MCLTFMGLLFRAGYYSGGRRRGQRSPGRFHVSSVGEHTNHLDTVYSDGGGASAGRSSVRQQLQQRRQHQQQSVGAGIRSELGCCCLNMGASQMLQCVEGVGARRGPCTY